jgi:hypothetical protein
VPLAAGYLKMFARQRGLESDYQIEILPAALANTLGDEGLAAAILAREPMLVGFTCYLWNIDRSLWIAARLKQARPDLKIIVGGPEITPDNQWVLAEPAVDYAAIGEGEQTFAELLAALRDAAPPAGIAGLWCKAQPAAPAFRTPLPRLDDISSPYLEGILDAAEEKQLLLETTRGCVFKCRFCYYPKSYDTQYFLSRERIIANLQHANEHGAEEVFLLDPTLNQRRDFADFLRLLAECNPRRQFTYSAELRGEGVNETTARLLQAANFTEVEIGLQSVEREAQQRMDRPTNMKAFQRGTRAMLAEGIRVRIDLIIGLPGDTVDSVRRGIDYLLGTFPECELQVFNLSILPGTSFRQDAAQLQIPFQPRPPYYALRTPTLAIDEMVMLMQEAQEAFGIEFDPLPPPQLQWCDAPDGLCRGVTIELDEGSLELPPAARRAQAFTLRLRSADFRKQSLPAAACIRRLLEDNPHTTLQVLIEPRGQLEGLQGPLAAMQEACFSTTSYLDRYYSLHPNRLLGAKRLVVVAPYADRQRLGARWIEQVGQYAALVWQGGPQEADDLETHEFVLC